MQPNRNLLVRKLDPPQSWNPRVENYLRVTGFYHVSRIGMIRGSHPLLAALVERWRPETHTFVLPVGEVMVTLEDVAHIFGLPIDGEPVSGWTDSSSDFVQSHSMEIFGRQPVLSRNSKSYIKLGWVRSVRDAELLDTEESIRRYVRCQIFCLLGSTLFTDKWSHADRSTAWLEKTVVTFRVDIDYMQEFEWRPYQGMNIPVELHRHLDVCDIVAPLLSFECIEWHPADRVMRQFGFLQPPPRAPRDIPLEQHCMALRGVQLYDWTVLLGDWIVEWGNRRNTRMRDLHPLPTWDFIPTPEYRDWYVRSFGHLLRLSAYVPHAPAPQPPQPPQHAVFEPVPYYVPQPPQPQDHSASSHHSQPQDQSASSHHSQHSQPVLTIPAGTDDWFDFSIGGHGDQQLQNWANDSLGGWSDFSALHLPSGTADPRGASVGMSHGLEHPASDHTSEGASCDSGFLRRTYTLVDEYNPGASAPAEAGGSAHPGEAGGSADPAGAGGSAPRVETGMGDPVAGHPYDLRTERHPPDRYTPSKPGLSMMDKALHWMGRKK
ncbi:hypothetical protein Ahy_B05g077948 [Arachis hypogaea]|uniref:Aminotransferase-like plant mobile domain-containing protein n=1 Tax=Arachis hypogaea TaxID=3818 RepID=A0A444Z5Z0_ARAHY|nr:hypothetical protein Ahy_B05g077948 [Arachis hypogaea]